MKKFVFYLTLITCLISASCSSNKIVDTLSTGLAGANEKGIPNKQKKSKKNSKPDAMFAITSDTDITLVGDFFPTALKMYEILQSQNPEHLGLMMQTGSLNIIYANAFVQSPAELLTIEEFEKQNDEFIRAEYHYLKGRDLCLNALNGRHKGFKELLESCDENQISKAVDMLDKNDVTAAYWMGAGWLGAFSLDPLNPDLLGNLSAPVAVLEKAVSLKNDYVDVYEVLARFYAAAPGDFGGDMDKAIEYCNKALALTDGLTPNPYIILAETICVPMGDEEGFVSNLNKALQINPDDNPSTRLTTTISQKKAKKLLDSKGDFFLEW